MAHIISINIYTANISLRSPYKLSFTTVKSIDPVVVEIILDNGSTGISEAVPLPGYSHETKHGLISDLKNLAPFLLGINFHKAGEIAENRLTGSPFALSSIITALEMATKKYPIPGKIKIPLLTPLSSSDRPEQVLSKAMNKHEQGYRTFKLKVGRNIDEDVQTLKLLLSDLPDDSKIRIDANQAYNEIDARKLSDFILSSELDKVECFEQPYAPDNWHAFKTLTKNFPEIPYMLDESIIHSSDVNRAAEAGAKLIKLKLFKHKGMQDVIHLADKSLGLGMQVVFGNGVSSDIGSLMEGIVFQNFGRFFGASEGNGFQKISDCLLTHPPCTRKGFLEWSAQDESSWEINKQKLKKVISVSC